MALTKKQRAELRMKFGGRCAYCGCELPEKGWHADHVQPVARISEQDMKAAEKVFSSSKLLERCGISTLIPWKISFRHALPATCSKPLTRWRCSENKYLYRLSAGARAVSTSAPLNDLDWLK